MAWDGRGLGHLHASADERMKAAHEAELLTVVTLGQKGRIASYQGLFISTPSVALTTSSARRLLAPLMRARVLTRAASPMRRPLLPMSGCRTTVANAVTR